MGSKKSAVVLSSVYRQKVMYHVMWYVVLCDMSDVLWKIGNQNFINNRTPSHVFFRDFGYFLETSD